jgi:AcrR family transcriptional regulator
VREDGDNNRAPSRRGGSGAAVDADAPPERKRRVARSSITAVTPTLRSPGAVLGPRANRTIASILDATRQLLLVRGYAGATIDEITRLAGVSRASFYTYFPSKRDVLLTLGADSASAATVVIRALSDLPRDWTLADLEAWVHQYFEFLDDQGSFVFAWTQAAHEDEEIRVAGMRRHLSLCRSMGQVLADLGDVPVDDPLELGLLVFSMIERSWAYCQLYEGTVDPEVVHRAIARMIQAAVRRPLPPGRRTK